MAMVTMILVKFKLQLDMRKIISSVMFVAATAMAFVSCQKQEISVQENPQISGLKFSSEKPAFVDETKTEWTGTTIQWSQGDKIRVAYTCDDIWQNAAGTATVDDKTAKFYPSDELSAASSLAQFDVPGKFVSEEEGEYVFYGVYPSSVVGTSDLKNAPYVNINLPAVQTPGADSFDPEADVMVATSSEYKGMPEEAISLNWQRLVAHAYITLKEINGITDAEQVISVTLTAQEGANLVGEKKINLTNAEDVEYSITYNEVKLNGNNLSVSEKNIAFWACIYPETLTNLTVKVETDKATYTRVIDLSANQKTFQQNARNILGVNMASAERVARVATATATLTFDDTSKRTEFTSSKQVWEENNIVVTNNKASSTNNVGDYAKPARFYKNSQVTVEAPGNITKIEFDSSTGDYLSYLKNSITSSSSNNNIVTITLGGSSTSYTFTCSGGQVRLNSVTVTYTTAGGSQAPGTTPALTVASNELKISPEENIDYITAIVKNLYDIEANVYSDEDCTSDCSWLAAEWTPDGIRFSVTANETEETRTGYIQLYAFDAEGNEYKEVIAVIQATAEIEDITVDEFLKKEVHPYVWYQLTGNISNITSTDYGNFDLTDDTGKVYVYGLTTTKKPNNDKSFASLGLRMGDEVTLVGTRAAYNGTAQVGNAYHISHISAPYIEVSKSSINVSATDTEAEFTIEANVDYEVECTTATVTDNAGKVTVTFGENTSENPVVHTVTITSDELDDVIVTITQAAKSAGEGIVAGDAYSYTFTEKQFSANGTKTLNGLNWTLSGNGGYWGNDKDKGHQFGSGSSPYKQMVLLTSDYEGGVDVIKINTSGASSTNATLTVTVNGVQYGNTTKLTNTATEYTFNAPSDGMKAGEIKLTYTQTSSKAIYIKSISINKE